MEGGGSRAGEVRKVHVVYFLSRNGEMEQPHLIRVRHRPCRDGVRLRDVKRWLSELRGKGMPDSFAWSYKRRYRTGYVWQDLADDDLITPICDNEYILKGSLTTTPAAAAAAITVPTRSSSPSTVLSSVSAAGNYVVPPLSESARTDPTAADPFPMANPAQNPKSTWPPETHPAENPDRQDEVSPKPPPPVDNEKEEAAVEEGWRKRSAPPTRHSDASTQTTSYLTGTSLQNDGLRRTDRAPLPVSNGSSCEIEEEVQTKEGTEEENRGAPMGDPCYSLLPGRRRGHAWCGRAGDRASHAFRNLLGCGIGAGEVDESALLPMEHSRRGQQGINGKVHVLLPGGSQRQPTGGGARWGNTPLTVSPWKKGESRVVRKSWSTNRARERAREQKTAAGVSSERYKPAAEPSCSQCGRPFRPERLHAHMRSCRALKSQRKWTSSREAPKEEEAHRASLSEEASSLSLLSH